VSQLNSALSANAAYAMCSMPRLSVAVAAAAVLGASSHEHYLLKSGDANPAALGFAPVPLDSSYSNVRLEVQGSVPEYLNGTLYRGAPGYWPDGWWLDGLITLNAFKFAHGEVSYSMQWNKDEAYNRTVAKTAPAAVLAHGPVPGAIPHPANSSWPTGVAFRQVQGQLLGSTGVSNANSFDFDTLAPIEMPFVYDDNLGAPYLSPTHEQTIDGTVVHHLVTGVQKGSGGEEGYVVYSIKPGTRTREVLARIDHPKESSPWAGHPSFQHMPLVTKDYYIMVEAPCYYPDTVTVVGNVDWKGWRSNLLASGHVRLVNRVTGKSLVYPLSHSVFAIHHINAYHDPSTNSIVVDTIQLFPSIIPCSEAFKGVTMDGYIKKWKQTGFGLSMSKLVRLTLPLDKPGTKVTPVQIGNVTGMEFPTIRYDDLNGKPYQFAYGNWMSSSKSPYYDSLIKVDVRSGDYQSWHVSGHYPGEPIFVPRPGGQREDDGVVMTNVLDVTRNETYLLLLDAISMKQVARVGPTPHVIPHGFHGRYYDRKLNAPAEFATLVV